MSSPIATHFPLSSPSRDSPNAHPYAIKTSSSAVLTRSNSVGHGERTKHHYTPLSPTKNTLGTKQSRYVPSHRHTRSMSTDIHAVPPPVPMPPSSSVLVGLANKTFGDDGVVSEGDGIPPTPPMTWRVKRSETLPSLFPSKSDSEISVQDLPSNPKIWTPSQLSVYLSSSLRLKGDVKIPVPVTRDIAAFVVKEHLNGRAFLRMKREDYDKLGINQLWKDTLLDASRTLRQNIVQGRIMGFGSGSPLSPRSMEEMLEPEEEEDLPDLPDLPAYSALPLNRRRVPLQWEEDKKRMSRTTFRAGRVRGMVETYERSVSGSSASGSDGEDEDDKVVKVDVQEFVAEPEGDEAGFASGEQTSASDDEGGVHVSGSGAVAYPGSSSDGLSRPLLDAAAADDAPSIEALLREQEQHDTQNGQYQSWGAKAWEDELEHPQDVHVTARRVSPSTHGTAHRIPPAEWQNTMPHPGGETARTGLAGIFEQPPPSLKATQDVGVGVEEDVAPAPDPRVYEMLEVFQKRLEVVEKKLDELERKDAEREDATRVAATTQRNPEPEPEPESRTTLIRRHLPRAFDVLYPTDRKPKNYTSADPSISGLPRYMFLISLGVVAVVTRVMLRRMIGNKKRK